LLVKPVVTEGADTVSIYLPPNELYYGYFTYAIHKGTGSSITLPAPLHEIPILMRAGNIIPRKDRPRRSSGLMRFDPYTLVIALSAEGTAEGELYIDDGESYDYQDGAYIHRKFTFASNTLTSEDLASKAVKEKKRKEYLKLMSSVRVEKVIVVGAPTSWECRSTVNVVEEGQSGRDVEMSYFKGEGARADWAVVRDAGVGVGRGWSLRF
jgi:mannosyl-oligosaccharide alpha-1,3-glucosidase